jgi:predicted HNH restriction endonuclease
VNGHGTCLVDVEPLCPNCHKSVHVYYGNFLRETHREDFTSKNEAKDIYTQVKHSIAA